uniref:DUF6414 family protein n=1 Tax=Mycolicibacterium mengxianglii TaxID=2736649 RepID=UPI0018EF1D6F|nr:hypothetical protein [Mycolicibacterium mengxianglii]
MDKVRGILSQIQDGVPETSNKIERKEKAAGLKNNLVGEFGGKSSAESSLEKSLGDVLFKILEEELESLSVLSDISEEIRTVEGLKAIRDQIQPGTVIRITAPGRLFHPEQLSHAMLGIATAATGLQDMQHGLVEPDSTLPTSGKNRQSGKARPKAAAKPIPGNASPEDVLFALPENIPQLGSRDFMIGMVRFVRGMFSDGVHLHFTPADDSGPIITARLETGRRFLDSTPEVLFSRYGFKPQEWTVVGTVGHIGEEGEAADPFENLGNFSRSSAVKMIGGFLQKAGDFGFIDLPTGLSFSVVPFAVYRAVGGTSHGLPSSLPDGTPPAIEPPK